MKLYSRILLLAVFGIAMVACSGDDEEDTRQPSPTPSFRPLTIEVSENPLVDAEAASRETRAAITTKETLKEFYLDYAYGSVISSSSTKVTQDNQGQWSGGFWPADDDDKEVTWYAHTNDGSIAGTAADPYLNFAVEETSSYQKDLLVATASDTWGRCGGNLKFTFNHVCSALRFYVKKATNLDAYTLQVSSIKLYKVVSNAQYHFASSSWTLGSTTSDYTLYSVSSPGTELGSAETDWTLINQNEDDYLFMIPQTVTAWKSGKATESSDSYLEIAYTLSQNDTPVSTGTAYIPFAGTFEQDKIHDVKINIGKKSLLNSNGEQIVNN